MDRSAADLWKPQEDAIAAAIRRAYGELDASACTAYLLTQDRRKLVAAMTVDSPLSFAIPTAFDADDGDWPITQCLRTGRAMVLDEDETRERSVQRPGTLGTTGIVPMSLASAPIRTSRGVYGSIGLRWIPPRKVPARDLEKLQAVADRLAVELESMDGGAAVTASLTPMFIPGRSRLSTGDPAADESLLQEAVGMAAKRSSFLHQLQNLITELTCAVRTEDVLAVAQDRVVRPYGGTALAVCLIEGERLHVVGAAGMPREVIRRMEGTPLARRTPETDTINHCRGRIFPSLDALKQEYPDIDVEVERPPIGYFPVIRRGRTEGCCVVEFAEDGEPLPPAEATLLATMLEKVGHTLMRTRGQEVEHALTRSIERSLLPRSFPHVPEVLATARYFAAAEGAEVGGDWYDVLTLPGGGIGLVIGDVKGHTLEAAAVMAQVRTAVRAYAAEGHEPAEVLERSNRLLMGLDTDLYGTCCCVWLDVVNGVALVASAGHPAPLFSCGHGSVTQPSLPVEPPLGVAAQAGYQQRAFRLQRGSIIALFTDGVLAAREPGGDAALQRLARLLANRGEDDLEELADRLVGESDAPHELDDDAALVVARYEGGQSGDAPRVARMSVRRDDLAGVTEVRHFLEALLPRWSLAPVLDDMQLMASEVVTNALIHAHSAVDLRLREYPNRIRVEVQDSDPSPPVATTLLEDEAGNEEAEAGRGLLIVDALAQAWGSSPAGRGKITWFEIGTPAAGGLPGDPGLADVVGL